jgi:hypothetical protein
LTHHASGFTPHPPSGTLPIWRWRGYPKEWCGGFNKGRKTFIAKGQETLDSYTAQENVFIALKHGLFLMTVIRKLSLMTDLGLYAPVIPKKRLAKSEKILVQWGDVFSVLVGVVFSESSVRYHLYAPVIPENALPKAKKSLFSRYKFSGLGRVIFLESGVRFIFARLLYKNPRIVGAYSFLKQSFTYTTSYGNRHPSVRSTSRPMPFNGDANESYG